MYIDFIIVTLQFSQDNRPRLCAPARFLLLAVFVSLLMVSACKRGPLRGNEVGFVAAPQVNLRDRVAAIYNKVGVVKNGDKVEILEHQKRFVRVRTARGEEGWMEQRYLVGEDIFNGFQKLLEDNRNTPVQAHGTTRAELNMHITPSRDSEKLYQLADAEKVELLKRAIGERPAKQAVAKPVRKFGSKNTGSSQRKAKVPAKAAQEEDLDKDGKPDEPAAASPAPVDETPKVYDDFWLVRNSQGHTGWVLARMVDLDVPLEIAQYSEGQRIMASFVLNKVQDEGKDVPQYLVLFSENKDGMPFDYNQIRVFSWNLRKHRYETAYRERNLWGLFPVATGSEAFDKEGTLPTFTIHVKNEDGSVSDRKYKLNGPIVRRVLAPGEQPQKPAQTKAAADNVKRHAKTVKKHKRK